MFSNILFKLRSMNEDVEIISILIFLVFFPEKSSFYYFLIFAVLITVFLIRRIIITKNIGVSNFSKGLLLINSILLISIFFSVYFVRSFLFFFDIFLISFYFIFYLTEECEEERYFRIIGLVISIFSIVSLIILFLTGIKDFFFSTTIWVGIIAGVGVLISLYNFLKKTNYYYLSLVVINSALLYSAESKAAFLGVAIFSLILVLSKKKRAIPIVLFLIVLTFIIPNPIKNMFDFSIHKDPYSADRIKIWKIGYEMFSDNVLTGVGADNFRELSRKYNFKQKKGPANYFKIPKSPHSDYVQLISEFGMLGVIIILFSLFFIFKRVFKGSIFNLSKILILYLLFQSLFFTIVFQTFFFFLFIFVLKTLFKGKIHFYGNSGFIRFIMIAMLIVTISVGYFFPFYSDLLVNKALKEKDVVKVFNSLNRAEKFDNMNIAPYYLKATILLGQFKKTSDLKFFYFALDNVKKTEKINPYYKEAYFLESDIFRSLLEKGIQYPKLLEEVISPLDKLENIDPFNPFIKMEKAELLIRFQKDSQAKEKALEAIKLEPKYINALYFLQKHFHYFGQKEVFLIKIKKIINETSYWRKKSSSYLNSLIKLPSELAEKLNSDNKLSD